MEEGRLNIKEKYLLAEFAFSFILLCAAVFLFGEALGVLRNYFILALAGGLYFSWVQRDKKSPALYAAINIAFLAVFIWVFYEVFNSSLFYKDVILLFVKAGFILSALLSLGAVSGFLVYVEVLSLALVMCSPIFINKYNPQHYLLLAFCFFSWAALLKLRFERPFALVSARTSGRNYPRIFDLALLLLIALFAWAFFYAIPLRGIRDKGFFIHETGVYGVPEAPSEQKYYALQEKLQDGILEAIPDLKSKGEILGDLSSLIKESADVMEIKRARDGLVDKLRRPGPGLEKGKDDNLLLLLDQYLDQKIKRNLKISKEKVIESLKGNPFSIRDRFAALTRLNKMQYDDSVEKVGSWGRELKIIIAKSSVSPGAKREIKGALAQFEKWKYYQLYCRQLDALKQTAGSLDKDSREKSEELISALENIYSPLDLNTAGGKIKILRYSGGREMDAVANQADNVLDAASRMVAAAGNMAKEDRGEPGQRQKPVETGGGGDNGEYKRLSSVEILPEYCRIALGGTKELLAMGIYEDGSHQDVTAEALWSSSDGDILSVAQGVVSAAGIGKGRVYAEINGVKSRAAMVVVEEPQLVAVNIFPPGLSIPVNGSAALKAEGVFSNGGHKDITSSVDWKVEDERLIRVSRGKIYGLRIGSTSVYAEYAALRSSGVEVKVTMTLFWAAVLLFKLVLASAVLLGIVFAVFYALTEERKKKIKSWMALDQRRFIVEVYRNTHGVLGVFGPRPEKTIPPLSYATAVEERYSLTNNVYTSLTHLFEEAKYSNHAISDDDASEALVVYNSFIRMVLGRYGKGRIFLGRCLLLLLKKPLYI
ncbi:MAG: hypothetical protein WC559_02680 [Candidatus Omnitrophota bacterium]